MSEFENLRQPIEPHPRDVEEIACSMFPPRKMSSLRGYEWLQLCGYSDQIARFYDITAFLASAERKKNPALDNVKFQVSLTEFQPRREGPGVPFGPLVDYPLIFSHTLSSSHWTCSFPTNEQGDRCELSVFGDNLIKYTVSDAVISDANLQQDDRDFLWVRIFALNKVLDAYCRLNLKTLGIPAPNKIYVFLDSPQKPRPSMDLPKPRTITLSAEAFKAYKAGRTNPDPKTEI